MIFRLLLICVAMAAAQVPFAQKQVYLNYSEEFADWDSLTVYPTLENSNYNEYTEEDSLFYIYTDLFSEWDMLTAEDPLIAGWDSFDANHFAGWDTLSYLQDEFHAGAYQKWIRYGRGTKFDTAQVLSWDPETALSYIPFGNDVTASAAHNPAYTGRVELPINLQARYFSDQLALTPYKEVVNLDDPEVLSDFITATIKNSFNIVSSDDPDDVSRKMERHLKHDVNLYSQVSYRPFRISGDRGNMELRIYSDLGLRIPGELLGIVFTGTVKEGTAVDVSSLRLKAVTAAALSGGGKSVRPVPSFLKPLLPSRGGTFKKVISLDLITGLALAELEGETGELSISEEGTSYDFDGEAEILLAGTGFQHKYEFVNPFINGFSPAGYGASVDIGFEIADDKRAFALYLNNIGAMRWNNVQKGRLAYHVDSLDIEALVKGGGEASMRDPDIDSLVNIGSIWRPVRTELTLGVVQVLHCAPRKSGTAAYSKQLRVYGEYQQALTPYAGTSFLPRVKLGIENDFLWGSLGSGYYLVAGGAEQLASGANLRLLNGSWFTLNLEYSAYGSPILFPKRGFGVSAVTQFFRRRDKWLR